MNVGEGQCGCHREFRIAPRPRSHTNSTCSICTWPRGPDLGKQARRDDTAEKAKVCRCARLPISRAFESEDWRPRPLRVLWHNLVDARAALIRLCRIVRRELTEKRNQQCEVAGRPFHLDQPRPARAASGHSRRTSARTPKEVKETGRAKERRQRRRPPMSQHVRSDSSSTLGQQRKSRGTWLTRT